MKLIDADALKEAVSKHPLIDFTDDDIFELIDNAPTVERPQGEWLIECGNTFHFSCSQCGCAGSQWDKFCRHCGAKMQKGGAE